MEKIGKPKSKHVNNYIKCRWSKHNIKRQRLSECKQYGVKVTELDEVTQEEYAA